ncbi:MAG: FG-GAP-like repeat-containing protein, partial [Gemmatimonadota bacterium]|nr:FG-GAP-like repeat-containing protein [Gemmatimonadota bacterium]
NWGACLPETTFTWSDPKTLFETAAKSLTLNTEGKWTPVDFNPADINGDGWMDLAWTETNGRKHRLRYALAEKGTGQLAVARFMSGGMILEYEDDYGISPYGYNLRVHTAVVDYNGDGRHDLLVYSDEAKQTRLHLAVPQSTGGWLLSAGAEADDAVLSGRYQYADLNSDGLQDAYKLVVTEFSPHDSRVPVKYGLEVRYLKPAAGRQPSSSRYYAFAPAETLTVPFEQLDPTPPLPTSPAGTPPTFDQWRALLQADVTLADVDGDGRADLVAWGRDWFDIFDLTVSGARLEVFRQVDGKDGVAFKRYSPEAGIPVTRTGYPPRGLRVQDLNQDGLSDLVYFRGSFKKVKGKQRWFGDWQYRLSTGAGWTAAVTLLKGAGTTPAPASLSLYDDNGDGYPDVLWHDVAAKRLKLKRYNPATGTFAAEASGRITRGKDEEQYFTADANGDGQGDLLQVADTGDTETLKTYAHKTTSRPHLITAITNGLGAKTQLTHESLSRTDAYVRVEGISTTPMTKKPCVLCRHQPITAADAAAFYTQLNTPWAGMTLIHSLTTATGTAPVLELMGPLYVVTQVRSSAPTGTNANAMSGIGYVYEQGKLQAAGRGLLGFKALTTIDLQTGVATTTTYRQDFPYIGYPLKTEVRTRDGHRLRAAANTWQLKGHRDDDPATPDKDESWGALAAAQGSAVLGALQPYLARAVERAYDLPTTRT